MLKASNSNIAVIVISGFKVAIEYTILSSKFTL